MKRYFEFLTSVLFLLTIVLTIMPQDAMASSINMNAETNNEYTVTRSDIIDWRYKAENGKRYRRLYNYSKKQWIGEWELC